jgi:L-ribulose-5-phosphate 3-epimerase
MEDWMLEYKLGIFSWFSHQLPFEERLQLIRKAGFKAVMLWWADSEKQPELPRKLGLEIANVHLPFPKTNSIWNDGIDGDDYLDLLISGIDECSRFYIPTAVIHISDFRNLPVVSDIGLDRFKKLVDTAEQKNVNLAFENLKFLEPLKFVFSNIKSDRLGFCYDSGHENCFTPVADCLENFGDKLFAIHLHDNHGDHDTHLLPFDGSINWDKISKGINKSVPQEFLTLEADFNRNHPDSEKYEALSALEYLELAYERLVLFSDIVTKTDVGNSISR